MNSLSPHFHVMGDGFDLEVLIDDSDSLEILERDGLSSSWEGKEQLRDAIRDWLPKPSFEIGFTNAELIRFVWNTHNERKA